MNMATAAALRRPTSDVMVEGNNDTQYWNEVEEFTVSQLETLAQPNSDHKSDTASNHTTEDYDVHLGLGEYTMAEEMDRIHHIESTGLPANGSYLNKDYLECWPRLFSARMDNSANAVANDKDLVNSADSAKEEPTGGILVPESYNSLATRLVQALPSDELLLHSVIMTGRRGAERCDTRVDRNGRVYYHISELPHDHYLSPHFQTEHEEALRLAVVELAWELGDLSLICYEVDSWSQLPYPGESEGVVHD
ncbi:hypothetical protein C8J57DRAFT_1536888 [Mycena rebaudengoi]|nr:hypothetical protein C8J57DRAFT_1536888 [Mycena rebaudengoi]